MSLERTPPRSRDLTSGTDSVNICSICSEVLIEDQSCMIIQGCSHVFHRICIETSLASSAECPVCKRSCQMSELRVFPLVSANIQSTDSPNVLSASKTNSNAQMYKPQYKGRGRGGKFTIRGVILVIYSQNLIIHSIPHKNFVTQIKIIETKPITKEVALEMMFHQLQIYPV